MITKTFKLRNLLALPLALSLLLAIAPLNESSAQRRKRQPPKKTFAGTALFVVSGDEADAGAQREYRMDALALFNKGSFVNPVGDVGTAPMKPFADKYFQTGKHYRLLFGGGEAGSVTVKSSSEGCNVIHSTINVEGGSKVGGRIYALATDSETLGKGASSRRALTASEREAVLKLVKSIYLQHKTTNAQLRSLKVGNLTATDLDGDGKYEVIGDFGIDPNSDSTTAPRRDLFLIATPSGTGYKAELANFQAYKMIDGFGRGISFADQLDIDGDGTAEVVAIGEGYDGYGYTIYKKRAGTWREVYSVAGDAC
jgi:hypothetical protein